jgi:hypothetical protein
MQRLPPLILPQKWKTTIGKVSGNLLSPMTFQLKQFRPLFTRICSSQRSGQFKEVARYMIKLLYKEKEERFKRCEIDNRCRFLAILDKVLTVGESSEGEEQAGWPHPHPGNFLEGTGEGFERLTVAVFAETLQQ